MRHTFLFGGFLAVFTVAAVSGQAPSTSAPAGATVDKSSTAPAGATVDKSSTAPAGATVDKSLTATAGATAGAQSAAESRAVLDKYCVGCHNARLKTGGLALDQLDLSRLHDQ